MPKREKKKIFLLDGAMGTVLQQRNAPMGKIPEELNITHPEIVRQIHQEYAESGSDIIYANTFAANRYKLQNSSYTVGELVTAGIRNAKEAVLGTDKKVALDVGPIGKLLEPNGDLKFEEAYDIYQEMVEAGKKAEADLIVFETGTDLLEMKAAVLAAKEHSSLPIFCTMTFEKNGRTFTGVTLASAAITLTALGVDAVGLNCSLGPEEILPMAQEMQRYTHLPIIVKPNAGLPNLLTGTYDMTVEKFTSTMEKVLENGASYIGGCCGTNPEYIAALRKLVDKAEAGKTSGLEENVRSEEDTNMASKVSKESKGTKETETKETAGQKAFSYLCSGTQAIQVEGVCVVGERINPTGKKLFKEALKNHNIGYILNQALEQVQAGAQILDVNVGLPEIDEKAMMVDVVKELQSVIDVPLQIDSSNPQVIEAALRVYNGKPLVNSVNAEEAVLEQILPIVKKYGAAVIGLTLDERGIPDTAEERFALAEKIVKKAESYGIAREDVYIDCLTLTASVKQAEVRETLKAVSMVKERLGVKTLLGVSNISFGLPNRELINTAFLTMALEHGLDLPIMNPNNAAMMGAVNAFRVLANQDLGAEKYVEKYSGQVVQTTLAVKGGNTTGKGTATTATVTGAGKNSGSAAAATKVEGESTAETLRFAILKGMKDSARESTKELLKEKEALDIVNTLLIPALDQVGIEFEQGIIFLPQLLQSAGAAQAAFEVIKNHMAASSQGEQSGISKGKIVLATVKGDIHDIGKNIVKVVLENYGYDVIDLGKDVPIETVVEETRKSGAGLVGLSALMTTTVVNMEATIRAVKEAGLSCPIMVGGAVLTPEYAEKIGADYYAKDAKQSADIAKKVFGE